MLDYPAQRFCEHRAIVRYPISTYSNRWREDGPTMTLQDYATTPLDDPARWGLSHAAVLRLGDQLHQTWTRFQGCFKTKTRDASAYAWVYLKGLLIMDTDRTYANIARGGSGLSRRGS